MPLGLDSLARRVSRGATIPYVRWRDVIRTAASIGLLACSGQGTSNASSGSSPSLDASTHSPDAGGTHPLCVNDASADGVYPKAAYDISLLGTSPDLSFDAAGGATIALHDFFEPCAASSRLLVVRVSAAWCGTCLWHAKHTGEFKSLDIGSRLIWLDLLVANRDNMPATVENLADWGTQIDAADKLAVDPQYQFRSVSPIREPLPLVVLIDTRTMSIRNFLNDPDPQLLEIRLRQELGVLDHAPMPTYPTPQKFDGVFYRNQWDMLHDMTLPGSPPSDPSNAKADDPAAAAFGKRLFSDTTLSPTALVACTSCHDPQKQLQDGLPQSTAGVARVDRNAPAIALAAHARWQFWDGRADTLWMQALGPIENPKEFGSSRLFVAHAVATKYASAYMAVFGLPPPLADTTRFPTSGKPGDATWNAMAPADQAAVTEMFSNVGKAIAAYERTLRVQPNRLDAYIGGDLSALSSVEKKGLVTFFETGCAQCHYGPRMTDDAFHVDRYPTGRQDGAADRGRIDGIAQLLASEFGQPHPGLASAPSMLGAFKTPPLRGVAGSAPYGHGGTLATLQDATRNYGNAGLDAGDPLAVGESEPWLPLFAQSHADDLVPFLEVLTAVPVP